jgi:hypothetical protein
MSVEPVPLEAIGEGSPISSCRGDAVAAWLGASLSALSCDL